MTLGPMYNVYRHIYKLEADLDDINYPFSQYFCIS